MSYTIIKKNESTTYQAPGHYDVRSTRLHNPADVNDGKLTMGLSHFLPGGGVEFGANALESIYYIIEGEMDLTTDDGTVTLYPGDSFHCGPDTAKSVQNNGTTASQMLVVFIK